MRRAKKRTKNAKEIMIAVIDDEVIFCTLFQMLNLKWNFISNEQMIIAIDTTVTEDRIGEVDNRLIVVGDHNNHHRHRNGEVAQIAVVIEIATADGVVSKCDETMTMAVVIQGELKFLNVSLFIVDISMKLKKNNTFPMQWQ